jgi:DNA-binding PadR family transcriptional regulator
MLGTLQQLVMLAALRLGDTAYGASIQEELERTGRSVSIATVYVTMERLESDGLVRSWLGEPTPARGGKARRHYAVTRAGARALLASRDELRQAWRGLERHPALVSR